LKLARTAGPILTFVVAIALFIIFIRGQPFVIGLNPSEVRNYNGTDLSSINGFRENSIKGPQYVNVSTYTLQVFGKVRHPLTLTYDQVLSNQRYSKVVSLHCVEGWSVDILWEGVLVMDIVNKAGPLNGSNTIIFRAADGYSTSFPLDYMENQSIILAYKMNNVTLPPQRGFPFQLVAESKWGYKWVKWISSIEISNDTSYKGYWESLGYSNGGDLNSSFFSG
jgi:DMSO/TMAO reductase YedYZ molybdopterin-dependent catalytic subunit